MIHPLAFVDPSASVGARTVVWQFASIVRGAEVGEDCVIAPTALIDGSKVGDRTKISVGVAMGPGFLIGNDCFIAPNVTFCNDAWPNASGAWFDQDKLLSGDVVSIILEDGACVFSNAVILPGIRIGSNAAVAAGAVCNRDVPANHLFSRDGCIKEINPSWTKRRMLAARQQ